MCEGSRSGDSIDEEILSLVPCGVVDGASVVGGDGFVVRVLVWVVFESISYTIWESLLESILDSAICDSATAEEGCGWGSIAATKTLWSVEMTVLLESLKALVWSFVRAREEACWVQRE